MTPLDAVVLSVSGLAAFFDYTVRRIPNWLILFGIVCGIALSALQGASLLLQSVVGFVVGVSVLIPPFALGWIGAGDAKFFGVVGALLGISWLPRVFFYSALVAGVVALSYLAVGIGRFTFLRSSWIDVKVAILSMGQIMPEPVHKRSREQGGSVPWGVAFGAGTVIAYYFDPSGKWAGF